MVIFCAVRLCSRHGHVCMCCHGRHVWSRQDTLLVQACFQKISPCCCFATDAGMMDRMKFRPLLERPVKFADLVRHTLRSLLRKKRQGGCVSSRSSQPLCRQVWKRVSSEHWAVAQLYPSSIFSNGDIFVAFQNLIISNETVVSYLRQNSPWQHVKRIVLDEAQVADGLLVDFFPSLKTGHLNRSLLAPLCRTLLTFPPKLLICGTGLSASTVSEIANSCRSPTRELFWSAFPPSCKRRTFREFWRIGRWITCLLDTFLGYFVGRPRHASFLAETLVAQPSGGGIQDECNKWIGKYTVELQKMRDASVGTGQWSTLNLGRTTLYDVL